ncbi:MAG: hypothetical protein IPL78_34915 [Chloroflexi bacterium]|nr:hypothetical protein [Chloroflexota bacterium]
MDDIQALKDAEKEQDAEGNNSCQQQNWSFPLILILLGIVFLLSNLNILVLHNWWALFFWLPAIGSLEKAWGKWQARGRVTRGVRRHLIGAAIWGLVGTVFLFGLSWGLIWPVLLIVWGVSALLQSVEQA